MSTPGTYPLELYRGDTWRQRFVLWNDVEHTDPVVLTGVTGKAEIRDKPGGSKLTPIACTITQPNIIDLVLSAAASAGITISKGKWDLQLTYPGGDVSTVVAGDVVIIADVTDSGG